MNIPERRTSWKRASRTAGFVGASLLLCGNGTAQEHRLRLLQFARGQTSVEISRSLERDAADTYRFTAKRGQTADILITSTESNASFVIYQPPSKLTTGADGIDIEGRKLLGGDKTDPPLDAGAEKHWKGVLPTSGAYYVQIATDRGNATYMLRVSVK
jgi:hypothetical protein